MMQLSFSFIVSLQKIFICSVINIDCVEERSRAKWQRALTVAMYSHEQFQPGHRYFATSLVYTILALFFGGSLELDLIKSSMIDIS